MGDPTKRFRDLALITLIIWASIGLALAEPIAITRVIDGDSIEIERATGPDTVRLLATPGSRS